MTEQEEEAYVLGSRAAWKAMLQRCLIELGYTEEFSRERLIKEREETVAMLRQVCERHGDNDWSPGLYLPDVIDKHLMDHLEGG